MVGMGGAKRMISSDARGEVVQTERHVVMASARGNKRNDKL